MPLPATSMTRFRVLLATDETPLTLSFGEQLFVSSIAVTLTGNKTPMVVYVNRVSDFELERSPSDKGMVYFSRALRASERFKKVVAELDMSGSPANREQILKEMFCNYKKGADTLVARSLNITCVIPTGSQPRSDHGADGVQGTGSK